MEFIKNQVVPAVVVDLVSQFIFFLITKYGKRTRVETLIKKLQHVLLKIHAAVEEAEGRQITNQHLLLWLKMLMEAMYRGEYVADTFKCRALEEKAKDQVSSSSFALSWFNPVKRVRVAANSAEIKELQDVLANLEGVAADLKDFIRLLECHCPMYRRPYSTYLIVENCMFGRHVEKESIINFLLLQHEPHGAARIGVLPIIGSPRACGKTTLVEHVYNDERVRSHFSLILLLSGCRLNSTTPATLRNGGEIKYQKFVPGRSLVIIDDACLVDEAAWRMLCSSPVCTARGSKIVTISRREEDAKFGTVEPIRLNNLSPEEYWYYFKALAFGSMDPEEHPRLATAGKEIAMRLNGSFPAAKELGRLLRANHTVQFWGSILRCMTRGNQMIRGYPLGGGLITWVMYSALLIPKRANSGSLITKGSRTLQMHL